MRFAGAVLCACLALSWACGTGGNGRDETGPVDVPGDAVDDAPLDPGADPAGPDAPPTDAPGVDLPPTDAPGESPAVPRVTVRVVDLFTQAPRPDHQVVLQPPDGARMEGTTDAAGTVTFPAWEGAPGNYIATAWADAAILHSRRLPTTVDEIPIYVVDPGAASVAISGTAELLDPSHWLTVSAQGALQPHQAQGADWRLEVPPGTPFKRVALEWADVTQPAGVRGFEQDLLRWQVTDHAGVDAPETMDLDFATPAVPEAFSGTLGLAGEPGSALRETSRLVVIVRSDDNMFLGALRRSALTEDETAFAYEGEFLRILPDAQVQTSFGLYTVSGTQALQSVVAIPGHPGEAPDPADFLPNPVVIAPAPFTFPEATEPLVFDCVAPGGWCWIALFGLDGKVRWYFTMEPGQDALVLPEPPDGRSWDQLLGEGTLISMSLRACVPYPGEPNPHPGWCRQFADSRTFSVKRPAPVAAYHGVTPPPGR